MDKGKSVGVMEEKCRSSLHINSILSVIQGAKSSQSEDEGEGVLGKGMSCPAIEVNGLGSCSSIARQH